MDEPRRPHRLPDALASEQADSAADGKTHAEFAGASMAFRTLTPVIVSGSAVVPVLLLRLEATPSTVVRSIGGAALFIAALLLWVRKRDDWSVAIRGFLAEGRAAT